jgi:ribonucleotide reductase beta subunit family protein with ferritin-like domain
MGLFDEQISRKPDLYPWTQPFIKALQDGFWTVREFNFSSDIQDFRVKLTDQERGIIVRALSTIGQLEISVKKFWAKLGENLPHPSINDLGYVMANSEVIHGDAYERLLEVLGLESAFDDLLKEDIIKGRVNYLRKHLHKFHSDNKRQFIYSIILFTLFVENIALFSQFYIIMWFGRYKNMLKDTNKQVEYTSREECYVDGTEVLTPKGWVDIKSIKIGDDIFQYTENSEIELTQVTNTISKRYDGDIITFSRAGNKCSVTPDHDMVFFDQNGTFRKTKAKDLKFHKNVKIPKGGVWNQNGDNFLSFEDRLKIAIQADGSNAYWVSKSGERKSRGKNGGMTHIISISRSRKIDRLEWILENTGVHYTKSKPCKRGKVTYRICFNNDFDYKTFDWVDLKDKSVEWCLSFLDEVSEWDGYKTDWAIGYSSTSKSCIDIVQTIAILAGKNTSFYANTKKGYEDKPCYKLGINDSNKLPHSHSIKKEISYYSGDVRCVTVPSGAIITRLDGQTFIAGNCLHGEIGMKVVNVLKAEYPDLFDSSLADKVIYESEQAVKYECEIIDWLLGDFHHDRLNAPLVKEFVKDRMNQSLVKIGYKAIFDVNKEELKKTDWFDEQLLGNNMTDFFNSKPTEYAKRNKSCSVDELFD